MSVYRIYFTLKVFLIIQIEKSVDGVLGIQTQGRRMVGADKTMELWRPPMVIVFHALSLIFCHFIKTTAYHMGQMRAFISFY